MIINLKHSKLPRFPAEGPIDSETLELCYGLGPHQCRSIGFVPPSSPFSTLQEGGTKPMGLRIMVKILFKIQSDSKIRSRSVKILRKSQKSSKKSGFRTKIHKKSYQHNVLQYATKLSCFAQVLQEGGKNQEGGVKT